MSSVPEPTEAMVEAATDRLTDFTDGVVQWGDLSPATAARWIVQDAFLEAEVEKLRESRVTPYAYERVCDALVKAEAELEGWRGSARGWKEVAVEVRAERDRLRSYTDSDVERVAEALNDKAWVVKTDYGCGKPNLVPLEDVARAALDAYLKWSA